VKAFYRSKIFWLCVILVLKNAVDQIATPGWTFDLQHISHIVGGCIGLVIAYLRVSMPDLVTGVPFLDKNNPDFPGPR
jgi:hypothetical protein